MFKGLWSMAALVLGLALGGCSWGELSLGAPKAVLVEQVTADIFIIRSHATMTPQDVLLEAAHVTKGAGAKHFRLISAADVSRPLDVTSPNNSGSTLAARPGSAPYIPPTSMIKPGQDAYFRILRLEPDQQAPGGSFDAEEIIDLVGRQHQRR